MVYSSRRQPDLRPVARGKSQGHALFPRPRIPALHPCKRLNQANRHVKRLGLCILLSQADSGSTVERQVLPAGAQGLPTLRFELIGVRAVDIFTAMHCIWRVADHGTFGDEEWVLAVGTAAERQDGIANGETTVSRDHGVDAESCRGLVTELSSCTMLLTLIHTPLQVFEVPQLLIRGWASLQESHVVSQLGVYLWSLRDLEEHVAQQASCCVATS